MEKRCVIAITDGDQVARKSVELVARRVGARCISLSAGNPTPLTGQQIVEKVKATPYDPVIVMLDDKGKHGPGKGEQALQYLAEHPQIELLGVVAVASNTPQVHDIKVDESITCDGQAISGGVDKYGRPTHHGITGDTVEILPRLDIPVIIGTGDTGKMDGADASSKGAPITTKAVEEILARSGYLHGRSQ